ncbi:hypothetical protein D3C76_934780 [compost metagenome]
MHQAAVEGLVDDLLVPDLLLLALLGAVARYAPGGRLGAARGGGVDADATAGGFEGQAGRERIHAAFGSAVRHAVDATGGDGRDVDDGPRPALQHVRQCGMAAPQGGEQRTAHFRLDLLDFVVLERLGPDGAADVVDEDVETAECVDRGGHHAGAIAVLFEVGDQREHALPGQFVNQFGTVYRHHVCAFGLELPAHATADALGGAGDEGDFALESWVHVLFSDIREWGRFAAPRRLRLLLRGAVRWAASR